MNSLRASDSAAERAVAEFLDEKYYPFNVTDFTRFSERTEQLQGKDVQFSIGNLHNIIVDEKAMIQYVNRFLPTFAFEITFNVRGNTVLGWLLDKNKLTEYYLCIWPFAKSDVISRKKDITRLVCMLISRAKLLEYLESEGFTRDVILQKSNEIRASGISGVIDKKLHHQIYFYYSTQLFEKPINIVIRRQKLEELADIKFEVKA